MWPIKIVQDDVAVHIPTAFHVREAVFMVFNANIPLAFQSPRTVGASVPLFSRLILVREFFFV